MAVKKRNRRDAEPARLIDANTIEAGPLPTREIADPDRYRSRGFEAVFLRSAWQAMHRHAKSRTDVEVGGVLLGELQRDSSGPYLLVNAVVPALEATQRSTSLSFTAESWSAIHEIIDRDHPGARIAGWYHTHPAFGVFLSEMDLFIHKSFFDLPHQVATVIDPIAGNTGTFVWRLGKLVEEPSLLDGPAPPDDAASGRVMWRRSLVEFLISLVLCVAIFYLYYRLLLVLER